MNAVVCQERLVSNLEVLMHFNNVQEFTALHLRVHLLDRLLSADSPYLSSCQENGMNRDILFQIQAVDWSLDNDRLFKLISGTVAWLWRSLFLHNLFPMVSDNSSQQQIVARRSNSTSDSGDRKFTMKERDENPKEIDVKGEPPREDRQGNCEEPQPGLLSKISGGVYSKAATVVGGVGWFAGTALSTTYTAVSAVSGVALTPFKKSQKDKSD